MRILVLGAGLMGRGAVFDLLKNDQVESITVADQSSASLDALCARYNDSRVTTAICDAQDTQALTELMRHVDGAFCAIHYGFNERFTGIAIATHTHMVDLGGNNDVVNSQLAKTDSARTAGVTIIPDCGLAPGMVAVLVAWGVTRFDWADTVKIRVGGLPADPKEPFRYERLFSVEGLINEYVEPPVVLRDGAITTGEPLGDMETVEFPSPVGTLEAFNTSGGTSTLPTTYGNRLKSLDYKTLRYPGHAAAMRWLLNLGLFSSKPVYVRGVSVSPRALVADRIAEHIPLGHRDRTVVRIEFFGSGKHHSLDIIDEYDEQNGLTSMMRMTAFPAVIVLQMICDGRISARGVVPQEMAVDPDQFVEELKRRNIVIKGI